MDPTIDVRRLRGLLAEHRIPHKDFAAACGLNPCFVSRVLAGGRAGELARIKMARGVAALGLSTESEVRRDIAGPRHAYRSELRPA